MISPCWSRCLSYELELRKEAIRLCKEQSFGIQSALWSALRNSEHRMKHWLQLVAIPNMLHHLQAIQELQSLKKRIADLENSTLALSTTKCNQKQAGSLPASPLLCLHFQLRLLPAQGTGNRR